MAHTEAYYLEHGYDPAAARYFANGRRKLTGVSANDDFTLTLDFDNGERRLLDMKPLLEKGTAFEPICDIADFKRVYLDAEHSVAWDIDPNVDSEVVWNNKLDLCPDSCYIDSVPIGGTAHA